jgi:hypothetical protein
MQYIKLWHDHEDKQVFKCCIYRSWNRNDPYKYVGWYLLQRDRLLDSQLPVLGDHGPVVAMVSMFARQRMEFPMYLSIYTSACICQDPDSGLYNSVFAVCQSAYNEQLCEPEKFFNFSCYPPKQWDILTAGHEKEFTSATEEYYR